MNMKLQDDYTPVALYARVSSDRQDVDLSVSAQLRALRDYAQKHGYLVAREYVDEAESGRIADRPQFQKMLDEASKPEAPFQEILVWKFSRFTRKREHAVAFKAMLRRRGVCVVSITEQADDTPTGKLLEAIIESVDEFYSENLAQEVTRGMREARVARLLGHQLRPLRLQEGLRPGRAQEAAHAGAGPARRRRGPPHLRHGAPGQEHPRRDQDPQRRGHPHTNGKRWLKTTIHTMLADQRAIAQPVYLLKGSDAFIRPLQDELHGVGGFVMSQ